MSIQKEIEQYSEGISGVYLSNLDESAVSERALRKLDQLRLLEGHLH